MAHILIMPRQGNTVESCIITSWKVNEGDAVTAETPVCEVETDKATFEVPAGADGTILKILREAGDDVPVLAPIVVIGTPGEKYALPEEESAKPSREGTDVKAIPQCNSVSSVNIGRNSPTDNSSEYKISPRAKKLIAGNAVLRGINIEGTGPEGRIIERDVLAALENAPVLTAAARTSGAEIFSMQRQRQVQGTGLNGRITLDDIAKSGSQSSVEGDFTDIPIKGIRKVISDRMLQSLAETAQFTLNAFAPVVNLQELRSTMNKNNDASSAVKITVNDLILFAVSRVLPNHLYMNAHKIGDAIRNYKNVNLGIAVDTVKGLMVPVIRNANSLSLAQISSEAKRLAKLCQEGSPKPDDLKGSTFTVTNLGSLGITGFTPVLNIPEVAILGVCGIELKPVAAKDEFKGSAFNFEPHIGFSLTINHQAVDGAPAARFLKALCEATADINSIVGESYV